MTTVVRHQLVRELFEPSVQFWCAGTDDDCGSSSVIRGLSFNPCSSGAQALMTTMVRHQLVCEPFEPSVQFWCASTDDDCGSSSVIRGLFFHPCSSGAQALMTTGSSSVRRFAISVSVLCGCHSRNAFKNSKKRRFAAKSTIITNSFDRIINVRIV